MYVLANGRAAQHTANTLSDRAIRNYQSLIPSSATLTEEPNQHQPIPCITSNTHSRISTSKTSIMTLC